MLRLHTYLDIKEIDIDNGYTDDPYDAPECPPFMFRCENDPCISESLRCNGRVDCPLDNSDELDCPNGFSKFIYILFSFK